MLSSCKSESESLLLAAAKQKRSVIRTEIKPVMSLSQKRLNPFKKSITKAESGRGLENLDASFAQHLSNKNRHSATPEQSSPQQIKVHDDLTQNVHIIHNLTLQTCKAFNLK
jgi:hypothetical protein